MKKGFVVAVVLVAVVGLAWCGWQIYRPIPEDKPYVPQQGEVVSQSDNARGVVAKPAVEPPKPEPKPAPMILVQPATSQTEPKKPVAQTGTVVVKGKLY